MIAGTHKYSSSGDFIGGLSLVSQRTIKLTYDPETERTSQKNSKLHGYPPTIRIVVPRRSLYIVHGPLRYNYSTTISGVENPLEQETTDDWYGDESTLPVLDDKVQYERHVSVLFRNAKEKVGNALCVQAVKEVL